MNLMRFKQICEYETVSDTATVFLKNMIVQFFSTSDKFTEVPTMEFFVLLLFDIILLRSRAGGTGYETHYWVVPKAENVRPYGILIM